MYLYGDAFSTLRPKERIWLPSFSETVLKLASDVSFSKATEYINGFLRSVYDWQARLHDNVTSKEASR